MEWMEEMEGMDALILFSHGSVLCGAGETVRAHARRIAERGEYTMVEAAFLNYNQPALPEVAARCHEAGAARVVIVPYFLVPGKFVRIDLPAQIAAAREQWPEMEFVVAPPIGFDESLADALLELAAEARTSECWREDLRRAADFCEADPECPLYGTSRCPKVPALPGPC